MAYYIVILCDIANRVSYKQRSQEKYQAILESTFQAITLYQKAKWQMTAQRP